MKKDNFQDLIDAGQLQREPNIGNDQVERLLKRAEKDLESAAAVKEFDEANAMELAYNAMFHSANALLRLHGLRPGPVRQHQGVIACVSRLLGGETESFILKFDRLRKRRNQLEYQGIFEMGSQELDEAIEHAKTFVTRISQVIKKS